MAIVGALITHLKSRELAGIRLIRPQAQHHTRVPRTANPDIGAHGMFARKITEGQQPSVVGQAGEHLATPDRQVATKIARAQVGNIRGHLHNALHFTRVIIGVHPHRNSAARLMP